MRYKNLNLFISKVFFRLRVFGVMDRVRKYGIMILCICYNMYFNCLVIDKVSKMCCYEYLIKCKEGKK